MFTPLSRSAAKAIKEGGEIKLLASPGWAGRETCMSVPHSIIYAKNNSPVHSSIYLFYCDIMSGITTAVNNVDTTSYGLTKPIRYLFLEMSVDAMENFAKKNMSNRLVISATVPGFAEVAFNKGFYVEWQKDKNLFKAFKKLKQVENVKI